MDIYFTGMLTGLALIVAIGAQNAFVLRQGIRREHVLVVVAICTAADAISIGWPNCAPRSARDCPGSP